MLRFVNPFIGSYLGQQLALVAQLIIGMRKANANTIVTVCVPDDAFIRSSLLLFD